MSNTALAEAAQEMRRGVKRSTPPLRNSPKPKVITLPSPIFVDCLLEPARWQSRQRRWSAVLSLAVQIVSLGILALIPLMFSDVLPTKQLVTFLVAPPPPPPPPPPAAVRVKPISGELVGGRLIAPTKIPQSIRMGKEEDAPPAAGGFGVIGGVPGGIANGQLGGVLGGIINSTETGSPILQPIAASPKRMRISQGVSEGQLIKRVRPEYPTIAKSARIQGEVQLSAWIAKDGSIERLAVVRGHPMLVTAALDAVKQWRFRPFKLNGEPIEVETTVTVVFSLSNGG